MLAISALAHRFCLSRSTLLHYDRIGLLRPSGRSLAGYRRYGPVEVRRLEGICTYRRAGLSLEAIARILDAPALGAAKALEARLVDLDREIVALREQQKAVAALLERPDLLPRELPMDKATWVDLLRASGMSEEDMDRWHEAFERIAPHKHQHFLEALGLPREEIEQIRHAFQPRKDM